MPNNLARACFWYFNLLVDNLGFGKFSQINQNLPKCTLVNEVSTFELYWNRDSHSVDFPPHSMNYLISVNDDRRHSKCNVLSRSPYTQTNICLEITSEIFFFADQCLFTCLKWRKQNIGQNSFCLNETNPWLVWNCRMYLPDAFKPQFWAAFV